MPVLDSKHGWTPHSWHLKVLFSRTLFCDFPVGRDVFSTDLLSEPLEGVFD